MASTAVAGVASPVSVIIRDGDGNTAAGTEITVTVALGMSPNSCVPAVCVSGLMTVRTSTGVASFPDLGYLTVGTYTLRVVTIVGSSLTTLPRNITVSPANIDALEIVQDIPAAIYALRTVTPGLVLRARDAYGNTVVAFTEKVSVEMWRSPITAAVLVGTFQVTPVNGVVVVSNVCVCVLGCLYVYVCLCVCMCGEIVCVYADLRMYMCM